MSKWFVTFGFLVLTVAGSLIAVTGQDKPADDSAESKGKEAKDDGLVEKGATKDAVRPLKAKLNAIFSLIPDATLTDSEGKDHQLYDFGKKKPLLLFITNTTCPLSRKVAPAMQAIAKDYAEKIDVLAINPNDTESKEIKATIKAYGFTMPYIVDEFGLFARKIKAKTTTECFLIDRNRRLRYRGAVNDQFGIGINLDKPKNTYLRNAIDRLLRRKEIKVEATYPPGCELGYDTPTIEREDAPTWYGDVEPIVQENCQSCHREGEAGPFVLTSYAKAKKHAAMIRRVVRQRTMPPWFANPNVGHSFKNDAALSLEDRQTLIDWVNTGAKEGDKKKALAAKEWTKGWTIGKPDMDIKAGKTFTVPANGTIKYRNVKVTTKGKKDRWVSAYEIRATEPVVVHHVLVFIEYPRKHPRKSEQPRAGEGLQGAFAGMVPGQKAVTFPEGMGKFFPAGSKLRFQIHYTAMGLKTDVDISLGLKFTDGKPKREIRTGAISRIDFAIPPKKKNVAVSAVKRISRPIRVITLLPHMHVRGAAFEYRVKTAMGSDEVILDIPQYDFNWQLAYHFKEHLYIPRGASFHATGWYDNSESNPANPNPKKTVFFGEQTWNEMMIGYFDYYYVRDEKDYQSPNQEPAKRAPKGDSKEEPKKD